VRNVRARVVMGPTGYKVITEYPDIVDRYSVVKVTVLPAVLQGTNLSVSLDIGERLIAFNDANMTIVMNNACPVTGEFTYCDVDKLEIRKLSQTCEEFLVVFRSTDSDLCKDKLHVGIFSDQHYVSNINMVTVFTPFSDNLVLFCNGTVAKNVTINRGLTKIATKRGCLVETKQIRAYGLLNTRDLGVTGGLFEHEFVSKIDELTQSISSIHGLNFSALEKDIVQFFSEAGAEKIHLKNLNTTVRSFLTVKKLQE